MVHATEVVTFIYMRIYVRAAIGSCDDEYGTLLNGNRSRGLGSCLVKVPGLFCIQGIMHARKLGRFMWSVGLLDFSLAVGRLKKKKKKEKMEKIMVWLISVYNSSDVF